MDYTEKEMTLQSQRLKGTEDEIAKVLQTKAFVNEVVVAAARGKITNVYDNTYEWLVYEVPRNMPSVNLPLTFVVHFWSDVDGVMHRLAIPDDAITRSPWACRYIRGRYVGVYHDKEWDQRAAHQEKANDQEPA